MLSSTHYKKEPKHYPWVPSIFQNTATCTKFTYTHKRKEEGLSFVCVLTRNRQIEYLEAKGKKWQISVCCMLHMHTHKKHKLMVARFLPLPWKTKLGDLYLQVWVGTSRRHREGFTRDRSSWCWQVWSRGWANLFTLLLQQVCSSWFLCFLSVNHFPLQRETGLGSVAGLSRIGFIFFLVLVLSLITITTLEWLSEGARGKRDITRLGRLDCSS